MAPGFGEDDQLVCEANEIEIQDAVPVDDQGRFTTKSNWSTKTSSTQTPKSFST